MKVTKEMSINKCDYCLCTSCAKFFEGNCEKHPCLNRCTQTSIGSVADCLWHEELPIDMPS